MASPVPVWLDAFVLSYPLGFVRPNKILRAFIADWLTTIGLYLLTPLPPWARKESQSEQEGNGPVEPASSQYACSELRCDLQKNSFALRPLRLSMALEVTVDLRNELVDLNYLCLLIFFPEEEGGNKIDL